MNTKDLMLGAMLTALSLLIPIAFGGFLRVYIPPFSATLASHLPLMLAMTVSPLVAAMVGFGSALGFFMTLGPVIGARALVHIPVGFIGGKVYGKSGSLGRALLITAPLHALGEALIVIPFGFDLYTAFVVVGIGTLLHHGADSLITLFAHRNIRFFAGRQKSRPQA